MFVVCMSSAKVLVWVRGRVEQKCFLIFCVLGQTRSKCFSSSTFSKSQPRQSLSAYDTPFHVWYLFFQDYMCKFWIFFTVIGITFLNHRCHFSQLQVYYFMMALLWPLPLVQAGIRPQLNFPFQSLVFFYLFEFSAAEIILNSISLTFWIQILPNKFHSILLIRIFPTTPKAHSNSSEIFSYDLI